MNRRNFLASAIAAALVPKALVELPYVARYTHQTYGLGFAWTEEALEAGEWESLSASCSRNLAASLVETRNLTGFAAIMEPILREVFDKAYSDPRTEWSKIFADAEGNFEVVPLTYEDMHVGFGGRGNSPS